MLNGPSPTPLTCARTRACGDRAYDRSVGSSALAAQTSEAYPEYHRGIAFGVTAYGMWGLFPLYWPLLRPAGDIEMLAHRMVWSLLFVAALLTVSGRRGRVGWAALRAVIADRRRLGLLAGAAVLITVNWGTYIYGVNNGHVVETA